MNTNKKNPQQTKPLLTHSEMMESLLSILSTTNRNVSAVKKQEKESNNENVIEITFLKEIPKDI